jgi:hypothetical protein
MLLTAASTPDYKVGPAPPPLLAGMTLKGEQVVHPGDIVAQSMLGRAETALLIDPIKLDRIGKLPEMAQAVADANFGQWVVEDGFRHLDVRQDHSVRAGLLPGEHRDPFDRLIARRR